jgi:hypothetical protein
LTSVDGVVLLFGVVVMAQVKNECPLCKQRFLLIRFAGRELPVKDKSEEEEEDAEEEEEEYEDYDEEVEAEVEDAFNEVRKDACGRH